MMETLEEKLEKLKEQMTEAQRHNIAEVIGAEIERRAREGISVRENEDLALPERQALARDIATDTLKSLYAAVGKRGKGLVKRITAKREEGSMEQEVQRQEKRPLFASFTSISSMNAILVAGILMFAGLKILSSSGAVDAKVAPKSESLTAIAGPEVLPIQKATVTRTVTEKAAPLNNAIVEEPKIYSANQEQILTKLDARRVELEQKKDMLDRREEEIENQASALSERLAELRSLTAKLEQVRVENDKRQDARLEQLSAVYGSMPPKDAAPLIEKLDSDIALPLLERLPGKKIGQILSLMKPDRAIELTQMLSKKKDLQ